MTEFTTTELKILLKTTEFYYRYNETLNIYDLKEHIDLITKIKIDLEVSTK